MLHTNVWARRWCMRCLTRFVFKSVCPVPSKEGWRCLTYLNMAFVPAAVGKVMPIFLGRLMLCPANFIKHAEGLA